MDGGAKLVHGVEWRISPDPVPYLEALAFMEQRRFVMLDMAGRSRIQGYLVQMDLLFVPHDSPLRRDFFHFQ